MAIICRHGSSLLFEILKYGSCEQLYHVAPYCWIARFTLGNVLPVARDLPISHIYGIKIPAAALVAVYPVLL